MPHVHKNLPAMLTQRLQPSLHRWSNDTIFAVDAMKAVTGWAPKHTFESAVEDTYRWWSTTDQSEVEHDYTFEDEILDLVRSEA